MGITGMSQRDLQKNHLKFSLPLIFSFVTQQLYSLVDAMMVGRLIGAEALAAVGNAAAATILFVAVSGGIEMGVQIVFSRYSLKTQRKELRNAALLVGCVDIVLGVLLSILAFSQSGMVMRLLRAVPSLFDMSRSYFKVYACGIVLVFLYDSGRSVLMGCGDSKTPFYLVLFSSLCNVILDYVMIGILQMGTAGAALATILSQGMGFVLVVICLYCRLYAGDEGAIGIPELIPPDRQRDFQGKWKDAGKQKHGIYLDGTLLKTLGRVAFPSMCQQLTLSLFSFVLQIMINGLGVEIVTGYTAASKVINIYMMAVIGFSQGFALMASRKIGEGRQEEIFNLRRAAIKNCLIYYGALVIVMMLGVQKLVPLFFEVGGHQEAYEFACGYLRIMSLLLVFSIYKYLNEDGLKAMTRMKEFLCSNFSDMLIRLVSCYVLTKWMGAYGLCVSFLLGVLTACWISRFFFMKEI